MRSSHPLAVGLVISLLGLISCSRAPAKKPIANKVPLTRVTGTVLIDGVPTSNVFVRYDPQNSIAETREQYLRGFQLMTGAGGKFSLSTYERGDGVPAGEYALSFKILEQLPSGQKDQLGGQYSDPNKPFKKITVEPNAPLDLGEIELKKPVKKSK